MSRSVVPVDDRKIVAAMCAQNADGLAAAYDAYAQQLHAYSMSLLRDHDAAADAVHDTFLIAGQRIRQLRDPERLRPWLYAIARHECLRQLRSRRRHVELAEASEVRDESVDLDSGLRIERYRELIWSAAAGLNPRDREVLELSVRHGLDGADLAAALGVSVNHAHALQSRARHQLERALTVVVVARTGRRDCAALDQMLAGWDGVLTMLWRKRIARHIEHCTACGGTKRREVRAAALLATVPFIALPLALRERVLTASADPRLVASHTELAARAGRFDRAGFPRSAALARRAGLAAPRRLVVPGVAALLLVCGLFLGGLYLGGLALTPHSPAGELAAGPSEPTAHPMSPGEGSPTPPVITDAVTQSVARPPEQPTPPAHPAPARPVAPPLIVMPNVVGMTQQQARQALQARGLRMGTVSVWQGVPPDQAGVVLNQAPGAGVTVPPGSAVALTVGGAPAQPPDRPRPASPTPTPIPSDSPTPTPTTSEAPCEVSVLGVSSCPSSSQKPSVDNLPVGCRPGTAPCPSSPHKPSPVLPVPVQPLPNHRSQDHRSQDQSKECPVTACRR